MEAGFCVTLSSMAINIRDTETERLASEVAEMTGKNETAAVRDALRERRDRLQSESVERRKRPASMRRWLETEIWPHIPPEELDQPPLTKAEVEEILGIGPEGY
jgi:antitoxin VapB